MLKSPLPRRRPPFHSMEFSFSHVKYGKCDWIDGSSSSTCWNAFFPFITISSILYRTERMKWRNGSERVNTYNKNSISIECFLWRFSGGVRYTYIARNIFATLVASVVVTECGCVCICDNYDACVYTNVVNFHSNWKKIPDEIHSPFRRFYYCSKRHYFRHGVNRCECTFWQRTQTELVNEKIHS